jgi:lipopolysaccharide biosynthesis glycosyltransferase
MKYVRKKYEFNDAEDYRERYNIAVCADENVIRAMGVLIFSILQNNSDNFAFHIFFRGNFSDIEKQRMESLSNIYHVPIVLYFLDDEELHNLYSTSDISITAYYRLLMPYVLYNLKIQKVLYLDVDILCIDRIVDLFSINLYSYVAYVIKDFTSVPDWWKQYCSSIGMQTTKYFNSGVMLINVPNYVKNDIGNKAIKLAMERNYKYMDQDVLNILLEGKVLFDTSCTYNCTMSVTKDILSEKIKFIHYTGNKKPWKLYTLTWGKSYFNNDREHAWKYTYYATWRRYAKDSPWNEVPYDLPKNYTEYRYLSRMYKEKKEFTKSIKAYLIYLKRKLEDN